MKGIEELESLVSNLPPADFIKFRDWFHQLEDERWDQQIGTDFKAGKFDKLIQNAQQEFIQGKAREL